MNHYFKKLSSLALAVALSAGLFLQNVPLSQASYAFTTETIMQGGYDYSHEVYNWDYDYETHEEILVGAYEVAEGAEIESNDLVLDDEGFVHGVVVVDGIGLQYFTNESGSWVFTTIYPRSGSLGEVNTYVGIEIGRDGVFHVVCRLGGVPIYLNNKSGAWDYWTIENNGSPYGVIDFTWDAETNRGHTAYLYDNSDDLTSELHYASIDPDATVPSGMFSAKTVAPVDTSNCYNGGFKFCWTYLSVQIAVDDGGLPYVVYKTPTSISYTSKVTHPTKSGTSTTWSAPSSIWDFARGEYPYLLDVDFDTSGHLNMWLGDNTSILQYILTSGLWTSEAIEVGPYNNYYGEYDFHPLDDNVVIGTSCRVECEVIRYQNGIVETSIFDTVTSSGYSYNIESSMVLDDSGNPHILYVDSSEPTSLKYATPSTLYDFVEIGEFLYPSIATDSTGDAAIAYYNEYDCNGYPCGDLKLASNVGGTWSSKTVDSTGNTGLHPDLFIDDNGYYYISYYDASDGATATGNLMFASNCSGDWETTRVDMSTGAHHINGEYSSIGVDDSGNIHIAYYDGTDHTLRYARSLGCSSSSNAWTIETVDAPTGIDVGEYVSMEVGGRLNTVHIAYYDDTNGNLKYAQGHYGSWAVTTLDSTIDSNGALSSLALDSEGGVHISYMGLSSDYDQVLFYITNSGVRKDTVTSRNIAAGWRRTLVDDSSSHNTGLYTSIDLNSSNVPYISYQDVHNNDLVVATKDGDEWVTGVMDGTYTFAGLWSSLAIDAFDAIHVAHLGGTVSDQSLLYLQF